MGKILEYLMHLENETTLYQITRQAFVGSSVQKESRIKDFLELLIIKKLVSMKKMGDGSNYYAITQNGVEFYRQKLKDVVELVKSPKKEWSED